MTDRWAEQFARFEVLLSQGNVFSILKSSATVSSHPVLSDKPFIDPSARPTGLVVNPAEQDSKVTKTDAKPKKKGHKSKSGKSKDTVIAPPAPASNIPGPGDAMQEPVFKPVSSVDASLTGQASQATGQSAPIVSAVSQTGLETLDTWSCCTI